jgi:hypothetical protein
MRNSRKSPIATPAKNVRKKAPKTDMTILENNPKIDHQVLEEYERLIDASKGVIRVKQGADYNIAHPLASEDMPTDAYHLGKRRSGEKQGADYNLSHPLASKDMPTDAYHRGKRVTEDKNI